MKRLSGLCALVCAAIALPALAADFVTDGANMLSAGTVSTLNRVVGNFNAQTGKEIVVVTVPSLNGTPLADAARQAFTQRNVNGVLIFIARDDRRDMIVPDAAGVSSGWFTRDTLDSIRSTMESQFKAEDYDGGVTSAVTGILNIYRSHLSSNSRRENYNPAAVPATQRSSNGGIHISMLWWIVIIVVGFLIVRSVMRSMSGPRYGPPGVPPGAVPPGGMPPVGYGQPGYGGGFGGGGGSFWSGLLGGLGGAWLGNEMFGNRGSGNAIGTDPGQAAGGASSGGWGGGADAGGGWQSDAGQADMGNASGGDWSGGGFGGGDSGGGGGDFGGGGGGDSGGGW
jgi:uncharacterized membrane protein YgcG